MLLFYVLHEIDEFSEPEPSCVADLYFNVQTSIVSLSFTTTPSSSQLLDKFDSNDDGNVDFDEFLMVDTYFPMAFFPVFRMQVWFGLVWFHDAKRHPQPTLQLLT